MADFIEMENQASSPTCMEPPTTPTTSLKSGGDPLTKLWRLCRLGSPLCTLFNALDPEHPLKVDQNPILNSVNACKASVYHFIVACRKELLFPEDEMFTISDLYQNDTNGFVKVRTHIGFVWCL
jgi:cell division control protein 24